MHVWSPGVRYHFKRLLLLDIEPPRLHSGGGAAEPSATSTTNLKLALLRTRQSWRIPVGSPFRLHYMRRSGLLLHRASVRLAAGCVHGASSEDSAPHILFLQSHADEKYGVIKGEKKLIDALRARFGDALQLNKEKFIEYQMHGPPRRASLIARELFPNLVSASLLGQVNFI